jgi:steroid 5-alpha reductase family enzyme
MLSEFSNAAIVVFTAMNVMFLLAMIIKNNSIIDIFWGLGFLVLAVYLAFPFNKLNFSQIIFGIYLTAWSLRLSLHIFFRNAGKPEDFRYANWRRTWKHFVIRSYFQIFMLQGLMMLVIALPVITIFNAEFKGQPVFSIGGSIIFLIGIIIEAVADFQLNTFRNNPVNKGHIIQSGLWNFSRHPNYFGEALLWWGLWIFSIPGTLWYITILSPVTITLLLRYVSGVPMMEEKYKNHPEWERYSKRVPVFIPGVKKK